jgi:hypothetical protein
MFIKDNDILDEEGERAISGTKGDYILREKDENGFDFSISFEMKNEKKDNIKGLKIEKHYPQANINRNKKKCKYCVIITTLEPKIEFTIRKVDIYENMFIARPEFFEEIITQLRDKEYSIFNEKKSLEKQLTELKNSNYESEKLEENIQKFKDG